VADTGVCACWLIMLLSRSVIAVETQYSAMSRGIDGMWQINNIGKN
jgi:hypothetical protein